MKQLFSTIAFLAIIIASGNAGVQSKNEAEFDYTPAVNPLPKSSGERKFDASVKKVHNKVVRDFIRSYENISETKAINVNINAVRDFVRSYKNVSDEKWFKSEDGYIASFTSNGVDTKVFYDGQGRRFYSLLIYNEDKLPFNIRHMVKSKYYDDNIHLIYQLELDSEPVYIIITHDKKSEIRTLKVCGSEMEDITQLN